MTTSSHPNGGRTEYTLPSGVTAKEFGKVNVQKSATAVAVDFTILMEPQGSEAEGWQTGVALDASASMKQWYGRELEGKITPETIKDYASRGWVKTKTEDGKTTTFLTPQAYQDAMSRGILRMTPNIVQPLAREFLAYLAGNLDADGGTTVIYWACGKGDSIEELGDVTEDQCPNLNIGGPTKVPFGNGTMLKPAVQYFVERFRDAKRGMYVFITDGRIDDLERLKQYTVELCHDVAAGRRNSIKCVLIGAGDAIDERQMEELDNLESGTDVDIWDHKIAKDMRAIIEIFAEVVSESQVVAPSGAIYDSNGNRVKIYSDGLPSKISATLPPDAQWFELEVAGRRIRQPLR